MSDSTTTAEERAEICATMLGSIQMYGGAGDLVMADRFYSSICDRCTTYPDEPPLRIALGKGASMMAFFHGRNGDIDEASAFVNDLYALYIDYPAEESLPTLLADTLDTLAINCGNQNQFDRVERICEHLRDLATSHPSSLMIQERFANTLYNFSVGLVAANEISALNNVYHELDNLSTRFPSSAAIRSNLGRLCFNLSNLLVRENTEDGKVFYDRMRAMAEAHPQEPELRVHTSMAGSNLALCYSVLGRLQDALRVHEELVEWCRLYPEDIHLREQSVRTARNILVASESGWDPETGWRLYGTVAKAVTSDPENATFCMMMGECGHSIWIDAVTRDDTGKAEWAYLEIAGLMNRYPSDPHLREYVSKIRHLRQNRSA